MCDIFTCTGIKTLLCNVAVIAKPARCTCNEEQVLQQNRCDTVTEHLLS